ncbi:NUDIX hydrolase [Rossellomorea aquimaris]|uniref:NUDIX hydrolase n=1 Tax=Rossellomorea aquimaris TaxID=189382 RepID=A0A5D4U789_9BACI|nr:NUDIX hydrolase [Rossellomorea aquimaris]TYS83167.1 NUDIX hydrolase [Rossellomorea aquimaris]
MKREDVVYALVFDELEKRVLMVKNAGSVWTLPGGAVETGETLEEAVIREVKEETNLTVEVEELLAVNEAFFLKKEVHPLFFTFKTRSILDQEEIEEIQWVDIETADERMPYHRGGVQGLLNGELSYTYQGKS